jgi:predicted DCC family thiol-disulfide oxidoreductase YuxK
MKRLYVLYDSHCALCVSCRNWLGAQPAFIVLEFIPLQSPGLEEMFPGIGALQREDQLVVIGDEGEVYQGPQAWIICLYALREYREWSQRLAHPGLLPFAKAAFKMISENRLALSRWFTKGGVDALKEHLAAERGCDKEGVCTR